MQMRHGNDQKVVPVDAVNQSVRESSHKTTSEGRLYFRVGKRKLNRSSYGSVEFVEEILADETFASPIIPCNCIVQFLLSQGKETDFHERRCLAITVW